MKKLRVFVGWDAGEEIAYEVCRASMIETSSRPLSVFPIKQPKMRFNGYYWRDHDELSSTAFTFTRFLTPFLAHYKGWAVFVDCDFLWRKDISAVMDYANKDRAVLVVKHDYQPKETIKMDGRIQHQYPRKNWSSFMLINCEHEMVRSGLTLKSVNEESGAYLHRIRWASDECIGDLPVEFNYLEGWHTKKDCPDPAGVHFTRGGPWFPGYQDVEYADEWKAVERRLSSE